MRPPRKFVPGRAVTSIDELVTLCGDGTWFYAWADRPIHPGWIMSQHLTEIASLIRRGSLRVAEITPEWLEWSLVET
jgi:hypothetical protein